MATRCTRFSCPSLFLSPVAAAALATASCVQAQEAVLPAVVITARLPSAAATVSGFGDMPLSRSPLQARVLSTENLKDGGVQSLSELTRFDASVGDAYNSEGYWSNFTVRGFALDARFNYRRDGLPISAETALPLANKERIEILKGTTGIQAGTSAPGGLVNLIVKRPEGDVRNGTLGWKQQGTWGAAIDLGQRFGVDQALGVRLNLSHDRVAPQTRDMQGRSSLAAVAGEWRSGPGTLVEAEFEISRKSQPSLPGMSLLGNALPDPERIDPRTNLNNQPWSQPVVLDGNTASLRVQQRLDADWHALAHLGIQRLRSDDRIAFPYGCSAASDYSRYCSDGTFDLYDFRSEGEHRRTDALDLGLRGKFSTAGHLHELHTGILFSRFRSRLQQQAYNIVGTGNVDGSAVLPPDPRLTDENTNRDERSTELYLRDAIAIDARWTAWLGLRHSRLARQSVRTDGGRATDYAQGFTTPWLGLSHAVQPGLMGYASWGQGVESEVTPNRNRYTNAGQALPPLKSRQFEAGFKQQGEGFGWNLAWFDIKRPRFADIGSDCFGDTTGDTCTHQEDGTQHHRGIDASAEWKLGSGFAVQGGAMLLKARLRDVAGDASLEGKRPPNVPERSLRLSLQHESSALPGLNLTAGLVHEGPRMVLPDNSISIPGWTRMDVSARLRQQLEGSNQVLTWRAGIDNLAGKRAWKEAPYQFGHAYLYPMAPRTFRLSVETSL